MILGSNLFHLLILKGKKSFEIDLFYIGKLCNNHDFDGSLGLAVLVHRGKWTVLWIKPYAKNKVV